MKTLKELQAEAIRASVPDPLRVALEGLLEQVNRAEELRTERDQLRAELESTKAAREHLAKLADELRKQDVMDVARLANLAMERPSTGMNGMIEVGEIAALAVRRGQTKTVLAALEKALGPRAPPPACRRSKVWGVKEGGERVLLGRTGEPVKLPPDVKWFQVEIPLDEPAVSMLFTTAPALRCDGCGMEVPTSDAEQLMGSSHSSCTAAGGGVWRLNGAWR